MQDGKKEGASVEGVPFLSLLMDKELQDDLMISHNSMLYSMLNSWRRIVKICHLGNRIKMFRWCAFDSAFKPIEDDGRFKGWISKGLTTYYTFIKRGVFQSFVELQRSNGLEKNDFYRYLQVRSFYNHNLRETWERAGPGFLEVLLSLLKSGSCTKVVSKLYNDIQLFKQDDTD